MQQGTDAGFDPDFPERQRAERPYGMGQAACQQRFGVGFALGGGEVSGCACVAGKFHVPTEQDVGHPDERVEPVEREQDKTDGFPDGVAAHQVSMLMCDDGSCGLGIERGREINARMH